MDDMKNHIEGLIRKKKLPWRLNGQEVIVDLLRRSRTQKVYIRRGGDMYVFHSLVTKRAYFNKKSKSFKRDVVFRSWRKNALSDLVSFSFNDKGQLVGTIEQPVGTVDHEEIEIYINSLARECDRFEYALMGDDSH